MPLYCQARAPGYRCVRVRTNNYIYNCQYNCMPVALSCQARFPGHRCVGGNGGGCCFSVASRARLISSVFVLFAAAAAFPSRLAPVSFRPCSRYLPLLLLPWPAPFGCPLPVSVSFRRAARLPGHRRDRESRTDSISGSGPCPCQKIRARGAILLVSVAIYCRWPIQS